MLRDLVKKLKYMNKTTDIWLLFNQKLARKVRKLS